MGWDKSRTSALPQVIHPTDLRSLVDSLPDPLVVADGRGLIRFVNGPAGQLFGQSPVEMVGTALPVSPDDRHFVLKKEGGEETFSLRWAQLMWEGNLAWGAFFMSAGSSGGTGNDVELERRAVQAELRCEQLHEQLKRSQEQCQAMMERGKAQNRQLQQHEAEIQEMKTQAEYLQHRVNQAETKARETEEAAIEGWTGAEDRARQAEAERSQLEQKIVELESSLAETHNRELRLNQELDVLRSVQPEDWQRQAQQAEQRLVEQMQRISVLEAELERLRERAAAREAGPAEAEELRQALGASQDKASELMQRALQLEQMLYHQEQQTLEAEKRCEAFAARLMEVQSQAHEHERGLQQRLNELSARDHETKRLAFEDPLTGLANYNILQQYLEYTVALVQRNEGAAMLLVVDLDRVRSINSTISHAAGDLVLSQFAERLRGYARNTDVLARRRADEFIYVVALQSSEVEAKSTVAQMAQALAQKIITGLEEPFIVEGTSVLMTCGIGLTMFGGNPGETYDQVLDQAYVALERAKEIGRNRFYFYGPDLQDRGRRRHLIVPRLKEALERQEFVLHYQPVVDLKTGRVVGLESLLRWHDPNVGVLEPKDFLSLAEESGLIIPIGEWAIQEACLMASQYRDLFVSINLSLRQILQSDFPRRFMKAVERARVRPEKIIVEVSESTASFDPDRVSQCLGELARWKVGMAIDDFGTSSTALSRLHGEHVRILKIDGSLVRQIPEDPVASRMVLGTCALAASLKLQSLAEGVESAEQLSFVRRVGCHLAQGRALCPPVGATQVKEAVRRSWKFS